MNSFMEDNNQPPELQQNLDLLKELPFFSSFPAKALKLIAFLAERDTFASGDHLFEVGDDRGQAYLVLTGQLVLYDVQNDDEKEVKSFEPGDFLGSLSLLGSMPSLFLLKASMDSTVLTIRRKQIEKIFQQFPETYNLAVKTTLKSLYQWERKNMKRTEQYWFNRPGATVL